MRVLAGVLLCLSISGHINAAEPDAKLLEKTVRDFFKALARNDKATVAKAIEALQPTKDELVMMKSPDPEKVHRMLRDSIGKLCDSIMKEQDRVPRDEEIKQIDPTASNHKLPGAFAGKLYSATVRMKDGKHDRNLEGFIFFNSRWLWAELMVNPDGKFDPALFNPVPTNANSTQPDVKALENILRDLFKAINKKDKASVTKIIEAFQPTKEELGMMRAPDLEGTQRMLRESVATICDNAMKQRVPEDVDIKRIDLTPPVSKLPGILGVTSFGAAIRLNREVPNQHPIEGFIYFNNRWLWTECMRDPVKQFDSTMFVP